MVIHLQSRLRIELLTLSQFQLLLAGRGLSGRGLSGHGLSGRSLPLGGGAAVVEEGRGRLAWHLAIYGQLVDW